MGIEIERKFLVKHSKLPIVANEEIYIKQGYILNSKEKVVRIRVTNNSAFITIKGQNNGISRQEFEYSIPYNEGIELLENMCNDIIEKTRYICNINDTTWEIDFFHGDNEGLIIAEVELINESETFSRPEWLGEEVSNDVKYYNNNLISNPYKNWRK